MGKVADALFQHGFVQLVTRHASEIQKGLQEPGQVVEIEPEYTRPLTEAEYYAQGCAFAFAHLSSLIDQIEHVPVYLREYSRTKSMKKVGITRTEHLTYHVENFHVRARAIEDRVLHLVSAVLHLGMDTRDVKYHIVRRNAHVKSKANIPEILKEIHKLVASYAEERNRIIHQRSHLDKDIRRMELWRLMALIDKEWRGRVQGMYMTDIRNYVEQKTAEFEDFVSDAGSILKRAFSEFHGVYTRTLQRLPGADRLGEVQDG